MYNLLNIRLRFNMCRIVLKLNKIKRELALFYHIIGYLVLYRLVSAQLEEIIKTLRI